MHSQIFAFALAGLLAVAPFAAATPTGTFPLDPSSTTPFARATPSGAPAAASVFSPDEMDDFLVRMGARKPLRLRERSTDGVGEGEASLEKRRKIVFSRAIQKINCLDSTTTETAINSLFTYGGAGTTVQLCAKAFIKINSPIIFTAANQKLTTYGNPTGTNRATIKVMGADQSCAIWGQIEGADSLTVSYLIVDGSRPELGMSPKELSYGLIEMGGPNLNAVVTNVKAFEPRGWSAIHAAEGHDFYCSGMSITNNQVGPAGHGPSGAQQFKRDTGVHGPGEWADGISLACKKSTVTGNTVTDATDGGIVIFGAQGSTIANNLVTSTERQALSGINMVDMTTGGDFTGVVVKNNKIVADKGFIKNGIQVGTLTISAWAYTWFRTFGGSVTGNTFVSGSTGYFTYAIAVAGNNGTYFSGNTAKAANFGGVPSTSCYPDYPNAAPQAFVYDANPLSTAGTSTYTTQKGMTNGQLVLAICNGPGPITKRGNLY